MSIKAPVAINRTIASLVAGFAFLGFLDAAYLSYHRFLGIPVPCGVSENCAIVNASSHAVIFGMPLSYLGVIFYLLIFTILVAGVLEYKNLFAYRLGTGLTALSLVTSLYLLYVQAFLIGLFCPYCVASSIFSLIMFGLSAKAWWSAKSSA